MPSAHHKRYRILAGFLGAASLVGVGSTAASAQDVPPLAPVILGTVQETGITMPLKEWTPLFKYQGVIRDVPVKEGEVVKAGQLLLAQDNQEELIELMADQKLATSNAAVASAKAALVGRKADLVSKQAEFEAKKLEYERVKKILDGGGGNNSEVDKAKYEMEATDASIDAARGMIASAEADIEKAHDEQDQAKYKADHQQAHLKLMEIRAQEDGVVLAVNVQPGDAADPNRQTPLITVVKIDLLKVEFHLPAVEAQKLKTGQKLRVSYDHKEWGEATVMPLPPVALAPAGGLQTVHMELSNPNLRAAGQSIYIELPQDIVAQRNQETALKN